jgi:hypothetical protein
MVSRTTRCRCCRRTLPRFDCRDDDQRCHTCAAVCLGRWGCEVREQIEADGRG